MPIYLRSMWLNKILYYIQCLNDKMSVKIILTGATGMVGEGVLLECLADPGIGNVLVIGRHPSGVTHPKLRQLLLGDFKDVSIIARELTGYDACFFCAGVSSVGKNEEEFYKLTYDMTINFAGAFLEENRNSNPAFCYVSGYGTDSTEKGKTMWARVKGKTENRLIEMFGPKAYMFRPGYMKPVKGQKNVLKFYFGWHVIYPVMKLLMPKFTCTLSEVGRAMINCVLTGYDKNIIEVKDIIKLSKS